MLVAFNTGASQNILWSNSSTQMWSTSKDWKTDHVIKLDLVKSFSKEKRTYKRSTIKEQKSNYDLQKRSSKIREDFVSDTQLNDIIDYDVTMDLQKKSFIGPAESCSHWLKITLWKKLGRLVQNYRIAI